MRESIKEESDRAVLSYGTAFFRASDLQYLAVNDVELVQDHLLSRLKTNPSAELITSLEGIGAHLQKGQIHKFVDPLIRLATSSSELRAKARAALESEVSPTPSEIDELISKRLGTWVESFNSRNQPEQAAVVEEIKFLYEMTDDDIPF